MILFRTEHIVWRTKNERFILTTHRIREVYSNALNRGIKSIMLENITSCELRTSYQKSYLKWAIVSVPLINALIYLINLGHSSSKLLQFLVEDVPFSQASVQLIFNLSIVLCIIYLGLFITSIKRVFRFHAVGLYIDLQMSWIGFKKRDNFLSIVERAKDRRLKQIHQNK